MTNYSKPIPVPSVESRRYWEALAERRLVIPKCDACGGCWFPPSLLCPHCSSSRFTWQQASGRGKVFSFVVFHRVYHPAFTDEVPYVVALVELEEGPRIISNITGIAPDQVKCEMPVRVAFEKITDAIVLPKFEPA